MIRYISIAYMRLSLVLISLRCTPCGGPVVSVTPSAIATKSPPPSPTMELDDSASKIDEILNSLTTKEEFSGTVLVARNGEILLSQG